MADHRERMRELHGTPGSRYLCPPHECSGADHPWNWWGEWLWEAPDGTRWIRDGDEGVTGWQPGEDGVWNLTFDEWQRQYGHDDITRLPNTDEGRSAASWADASGPPSSS